MPKDTTRFSALAAGWLVFYSLPFIFMLSQFATTGNFSTTGIFIAALAFTVYIAIFYLHTYFLFPRLFFKGKKGLYFFSVAALLAGVFFLKPFDRLTRLNRSLTAGSFDRNTFPLGRADWPPRDMNNGTMPPPRPLPAPAGRARA